MKEGLEDFISYIAQNGSITSCFIGFQQSEGISISEDVIKSYEYGKNGRIKCIECDLKTKEMKVMEKVIEGSNTIIINLSDVQSNSEIDMNIEGLYWEGPSLNGYPFGYGSVYNNKGMIIYKGFMSNNEKVCFGCDYFFDSDAIEYCGSFWKNQRHGSGKLFNKDGEVIYEGGFICGCSNYERILRIADHCCDDKAMNSFIEDLVIGNDCFKSIESLKLSDLQFLSSIRIGNESFYETTYLSLLSNLIDGLIDLIFLNSIHLIQDHHHSERQQV